MAALQKDPVSRRSGALWIKSRADPYERRPLWVWIDQKGCITTAYVVPQSSDGAGYPLPRWERRAKEEKKCAMGLVTQGLCQEPSRAVQPEDA